MSESSLRVEVVRGFRWEGVTFQPDADGPVFINMPEPIARELAANGKVKLPLETVKPKIVTEPVPVPATLLVRVLRPFLLMGEPVPVTDADGNPTVIELHSGFARQLVTDGKVEIVPAAEAPPVAAPEPALAD